jgi:hypothetical protein
VLIKGGRLLCDIWKLNLFIFSFKLRGFTLDERKSGGLHEKHAVAAWNHWKHFSDCFKTALWDIRSACAACSPCPHRPARHTQ